MFDALELLAGMVDQHCSTPNLDYPLSSGYISINAEAMRLLAHHGMFVITDDDGDRYVEGYIK